MKPDLDAMDVRRADSWVDGDAVYAISERWPRLTENNTKAIMLDSRWTYGRPTFLPLLELWTWYSPWVLAQLGTHTQTPVA
jgi:hypothetical protein